MSSGRFSWLALLSFILLTGCLVDPFSSVPEPDRPVPTASKEWYSLYFTEPGLESPAFDQGGPDEDLAAAIDRAQFSVDVAAYDLNLSSIRDALLSAYERNLDVRMVVESDNLDGDEIQSILGAGIPILGDRREGLMHDKFVIIDNQEVWTGSMNFTVGDAYLNNNNLICVRSSRLAEDYTRQFEDMFLLDLFGPDGIVDTPFPTLEGDGTFLEVFFSPEDRFEQRLLELIQSSQKSIYFLAFSFTSDDLAEALIEQARLGVRVVGVLDAAQSKSNQGGEYERLRSNGVEVYLDGNRGLMHHKVMVFDEQIVVTGSYNFTASAENRNDENSLVIHDQGVAASYLEEFRRLFSQAKGSSNQPPDFLSGWRSTVLSLSGAVLRGSLK